MKIEIRIQISQAGTHQFFSSRGNKSFAMQMMFPVPILPLIHLDRQTVWALESDPVHKSFLQPPYQGRRIFYLDGEYSAVLIEQKINLFLVLITVIKMGGSFPAFR